MLAGQQPPEADPFAPLSLEGLVLDEVIDFNLELKTISLVGHFESDPQSKTLVKLEKKAFDLNLEVIRETFRRLALAKQTHGNNVYYKFDLIVGEPAADSRLLQLSPELSSSNLIKCEVVHPVPEKILLKNTASPSHLIEESPELYQACTLPFIQALPAESIQWILNITDLGHEKEHVLFRREGLEAGWTLVKDYKVDKEKKEGFHFNALLHRKDIRSIRDVTADHIPLLEDIVQTGKRAIAKEVGIDEDVIRVYVHYPPSFYHFHVHFIHVKVEGSGVRAERAMLLSTILQNLRLKHDYYQQATN